LTPKPSRRRSSSDADGGAKQTRRAALNEDVAREIDALRAALDEMVRRYKLEVGGNLADLERRLLPDPGGGSGKRKQLPIRTAQQVLDAIRAVQLRPDRGRPKDFTRLKRLVREISALWPG
jgi:hypothetical protein